MSDESTDPPETKHAGPYMPPPLTDDEPPVIRSPILGHLRPPRLSILHLMAWMGITAVLIKYGLFWEDLFGGQASEYSPVITVFRRVLSICYNTTHAAVFVAAGILVLCKFRRVPGRLQPGHWLLLITTVSFLLSYATNFVCFFVDRFLEPSIDFFPLSIFSLMYAVMGWFRWIVAAVYVILAVRSREARRWKVAYGTVAATNGITGAGLAMNALFHTWLLTACFPICFCILAGVLLVVVILDVRRGSRRDWLHWFGMIYVGVAAFLSIAWQVQIVLLRYSS